jgi:hypothetical protein
MWRALLGAGDFTVTPEERAEGEALALRRARLLRRKPPDVRAMSNAQLRDYLGELRQAVRDRGARPRGKEADTLRDMLTRAPSGIDTDLEAFKDYLEQEHVITVRPDGLIHFDRLTPAVRRLVGSLPIVMYHHTSSVVAHKAWVEGLKIRDVPSANPDRNSTAGVYVTTEASGAAPTLYQRMSVRFHGGQPVTLTIRTQVPALENDPDDKDLPAARGRQFILPSVAPSAILRRA